MKRFTQIFESTLSRHTNGGFLTSDLVKLKKNALSHVEFETNEEMKFKLKAIMDSDLNLRIVNIKNKYPAVQGGVNTDTNLPFGRIIDIAQEIAPGRFHNFISVPEEVLERIESYPNSSPIPNSLKRDDTTQIEPIPVDIEEDEECMLSPRHLTHKSDDGKGHLIKGDRELKNTNTKIPAEPAKGQADPADYVARYLPKRR